MPTTTIERPNWAETFGDGWADQVSVVRDAGATEECTAPRQRLSWGAPYLNSNPSEEAEDKPLDLVGEHGHDETESADYECVDGEQAVAERVKAR
jgi:hypothetical protein